MPKTNPLRDLADLHESTARDYDKRAQRYEREARKAELAGKTRETRAWRKGVRNSIETADRQRREAKKFRDMADAYDAQG
jgi:hypothetical protein